MTDTTVAAPVAAVVNDVNAALDTPEVQALDAAVVAVVEPKIPAKARAVIYEIIKWAGLLGSAATATAAVALHGDSQLYVATGGFILTAIVSTFAKAHVTK